MAAMMAAAGTRLVVTVAAAGTAQQAASTAKKPAPIPAEEIDRLLAPVALYPDQLLAQILMCASDPAKVVELNAWMKKNATLKGTPLQDAAVKAGFEPSFVALVLFPDIVNMMAVQKDWTTRLGQAFAADRSAVFGSIQRLRAQAQKAGNLKDTPQQEVETKTTSAGEQVIVIEPSNPQVVYVPQYNPTTVLRPAEQQQRRCGSRGNHRLHGRDRDRRGDRQRLLLRSVRLARRRVHVQRRVGRLLRPP